MRSTGDGGTAAGVPPQARQSDPPLEYPDWLSDLRSHRVDVAPGLSADFGG